MVAALAGGRVATTAQRRGRRRQVVHPVYASDEHNCFANIATVLIQPLAQSRSDQRRFIDRNEETRSIIDAVKASQPVLVLGERGSGRTSLLNHVAWLLAHDETSRDSVLISGELARDPAQLLGVLVARVGRLAQPGGSRARWLEDLQALSMPDGPFGAVVQPALLMELIDLLGERLAELERQVCLMIDEVLPAVAHGVFGTLRNELWTLPGASWIVAGESAAEALYREPPADAFFAQTVVLAPLSDANARKLLHAHIPNLGEPDVEKALAAGDGNLTPAAARRRRHPSRHPTATKSPRASWWRRRRASPGRSPDASSNTSQSKGRHPLRMRACCVRSARAASAPAS